MIRIYILMGLMFLCAVVGWHYRHTIAQNALLKGIVAKANSYIGAQDYVIDENRKLDERANDEIDKIENTPQANDGPIAPVLRDTLGSM